MNSLFLPVMILLISSTFVSSQQITWVYEYGGSDFEYGFSIHQTSDGGYISCGFTNSYGAGSSDVYLIKVDSLGNQLWYNTFGGINGDYGKCVQQTSDGGYIIAGVNNTSGSRAYLIKTDENGTELWSSTLNNSKSSNGNFVVQTTDEGYIVVGQDVSGSYADIRLIKTDSNGNISWDKLYGGSMADVGYCVQQTSDGGYIICGVTDDGDGPYVYLLRTNSSGSILWERTYGEFGMDSRGKSVRQLPDEGFVICGSTYVYVGDDYRLAAYLVRTDFQGNMIWEQTFAGNVDIAGLSVDLTSDGGFIICGNKGPYGEEQDVYFAKVNSVGNLIWERTYDACSVFDSGESIQQTNDGGFIIAGWTGNFVTPVFDMLLIKTDSQGYVGIDTSEDLTTEPLITFPNPTTSEIMVSFQAVSEGSIEAQLYDLTGRLTDTWNSSSSADELSIRLEAQNQGLHFVRITTSEGAYSFSTVVLD